MKKLIVTVLAAAAAIDIFGDAQTSTLVSDLSNRAPTQSVWSIVMASPIWTTVGHWALFFVGLGVLSFVMSARKRTGPDILG